MPPNDFMKFPMKFQYRVYCKMNGNVEQTKIISNTFSESIFCIHGIFWPEIIHGENAHGA